MARGTEKRDIYHGSGFDDEYFGLGGDDDLFGEGGNDTLSGGLGNDFIKGGEGDDSLFGGGDNDVLISGEQDTFSLENYPFVNPTNGGNDSLDGGSGDDRLIVTFDSKRVTAIGGTGNDTLQMGFDTPAVRAFVDAFQSDFITDPDVFTAFIDLNEGVGQYRFNGRTFAVDLTIDGIENIDGSVFFETLTGTSGVNIINAGDGNDIIEGLGGGDTINGGSGRDRAVYASSSAAVDIDLTRGLSSIQLGGDAQGDRLTSIEDVTGSRFADLIRGNSAANDLVGGRGDDVLEGRGGADRIDGGLGIDTATYQLAQGGVIVDLRQSTQSNTSAGEALGDVLVSIENLIGSNFGDTLTGSAEDNIIEGGFGNDFIDGQGGFDTASYEHALQGVQFTLGAPGFRGTARQLTETDTLLGIENAIGSNLADTFFGNSIANIFNGGKGADVFYSSAGGDTYIGGEGVDTADYSQDAVSIVVNTITGIVDRAAILPSAFQDKVSEIERFVGTRFDDQFISGFATDIFVGGSGNDTYFVANAATQILESAGRGSDEVITSVDYTLAAGQEIEGLSAAAGTFPTNLTGNEFANHLTGNGGGNILSGGGNNDVVEGLGGNDTYLFTGANQGRDTFSDSSGADTAVFDFSKIQSVSRSGNDLVVDLGDGGFTVIGHFSGFAIESARDITTGRVVTLAVGLTGGDAPGIIAGTKGDETLDGRGGDDLLYGFAGNDRLLGGTGQDFLDGGKGKDVLIGGEGADVLIGGAGNDVFVFDQASGHDVIRDFGDGHDRIDLTAFHSSFRSLDDNRNGRLDNGEGDAVFDVCVSHGDTILAYAGGSIRVAGDSGLAQTDFLF